MQFCTRPQGAPVLVTAAGVDTWSPAWYVHPEGAAAAWLRTRATVRGPRGSQLLPEAIEGHRVGWFPSGMIFAEGHPAGEALCPAGELAERFVALEEAMASAGVPLPVGERAFDYAGPASEGFAGLRRCDATVNLKMGSTAEGLGVLAAIAALVRDASGQADVRFGADRRVETVYLLGRAGKNKLGRWYDKGLESTTAPRGQLLRAEDQRRWPKGHRREVEELTAEMVRGQFVRRFKPLWQATKGVTVAGPMAIAHKLGEAVAAGDITQRQAASALGDLMLEQAAGVRQTSRWTQNRRRTQLRELGLVLADGVLEEVEVDVGQVLEAVLETDAWERRG